MQQISREMLEAQTKGVTVAELIAYNARRANIRMQLEELALRLADAKKSVDHQMQIVVEASREVSKFEKVEERQYEVYREGEKKAETARVEELVLNNVTRRQVVCTLFERRRRKSPRVFRAAYRGLSRRAQRAWGRLRPAASARQQRWDPELPVFHRCPAQKAEKAEKQFVFRRGRLQCAGAGIVWRGAAAPFAQRCKKLKTKGGRRDGYGCDQCGHANAECTGGRHAAGAGRGRRAAGPVCHAVWAAAGPGGRRGRFGRPGAGNDAFFYEGRRSRRYAAAAGDGNDGRHAGSAAGSGMAFGTDRHRRSRRHCAGGRGTEPAFAAAAGKVCAGRAAGADTGGRGRARHRLGRAAANAGNRVGNKSGRARPERGPCARDGPYAVRLGRAPSAGADERKAARRAGPDKPAAGCGGPAGRRG